ncbi:hypothetical protein SBG_0790 [Salmonella bongori NCTC 12419]|uniref:Uncharacterized protein n=1 Tax=Salmonella bongori (strain ATCC 43975 / DSM 13772 / NCTC 12419) TaxID=218493 RepID=A0A0K0H920_SALBC|nr:hypothetical protein SBG_0790 [Salmonella bongori NCTC 12419]
MVFFSTSLKIVLKHIIFSDIQMFRSGILCVLCLSTVICLKNTNLPAILLHKPLSNNHDETQPAFVAPEVGYLRLWRLRIGLPLKPVGPREAGFTFACSRASVSDQIFYACTHRRNFRIP